MFTFPDGGTGVWSGWIWGSGFGGRVNSPATTHTPSGNSRSPHLPPGSTTCQPLPAPCVPAVDTGTQGPKPLGMTGCPGGHWTKAPPPTLDKAPSRPPMGGTWPPQGMRNPLTFLGQNTHPDSPQPTSSPPTPIYDAHLVNRGAFKPRNGVHTVSGCWSLGAGVSRPKPIGDYR